MFEIFVDSAANIPAELVKKFKIKVLSFVNLVNGKEVTCFDPNLTPEEERQKGNNERKERGISGRRKYGETVLMRRCL